MDRSCWRCSFLDNWNCQPDSHCQLNIYGRSKERKKLHVLRPGSVGYESSTQLTCCPFVYHGFIIFLVHFPPCPSKNGLPPANIPPFLHVFVDRQLGPLPQPNKFQLSLHFRLCDLFSSGKPIEQARSTEILARIYRALLYF